MIRALSQWVVRLLRPRLARSVRIKSLLYRLYWLLPEKYREQNLARTALKRLAATRRSVTFLNIGANDGLSGDPLREFIYRYGWRGVLVEPVDYVFARLRRAYAGRPGIRFENAAIAPASGAIPFWYIRDNETLPPGSDQIGSFDREQVAKHAALFPGLDAYITGRTIPCLTLPALLDKHRIERLDLVLIDTEGYDYTVIKQFDLEQMPPALLIYEEVHLADADKAACRALLEKAGYSLEGDGFDVVAWRRGAD